MADTTTTQIDSAVNNYFDRNLLVRAYPAFVHTRFAQVKDIPRNGSNVIKFRRYTNLTAATTALTEGVTPVGSQLAKTDVTATVLQYGRQEIAVLKSSLISLFSPVSFAL